MGENIGSVISVLSFILNSVVLSGFVIPQIQELKRIKDQILKFEIAFPSDSLSNHFTDRRKREKMEEDSHNLQKLIDTYYIRFQELKPLISIFHLSILVAILAILLISFPDRLNPFLGIQFSRYVIVGHSIIQLALLVFGVRIFALNPNKLQQAGYLVRELDVNPHSLVAALGLATNVSINKPLSEKTKESDPLQALLKTNLRVFGYRFLYVVYGENNEDVYFVSCGPITPDTEISRSLVPKISFWKSGELNHIELGSFQFNAIKKKPQRLNILLLVFIPFFKNETLSPFYVENSFEIGKSSGHTISISNSAPVDPMKRFNGVQYRGSDNKIIELKCNIKKQEYKIVGDVVEKFKREIMVRKNIKQYSDLEGKLLSNSKGFLRSLTS